jgi:hypothetical protein
MPVSLDPGFEFAGPSVLKAVVIRRHGGSKPDAKFGGGHGCLNENSINQLTIEKS